MTATTAEPATGTTTGDQAGELPAPSDRGRTRIADRVVEKVAARAVAEVDNATGVARQVLGVRLGAAGDDAPARVNADVDGGVVLVRVTMAVQWPAPVREVTRQVRAHVTDRVAELTGLQVAGVDIDVSTLLRADDASDAKRRVV